VQQSTLFDQLVGAPGQVERNGDAECLGCLEIDDHLDCRRPLDRQVAGFFALENAAGVNAGSIVGFRKIASVAREAAGPRERAKLIDCRDRMAPAQGAKLFTSTIEKMDRRRSPIRRLRAWSKL